MLQGVIGLILVGLGVVLMVALKPREALPPRLRGLPAIDILAPLTILTLFIVGGVLLVSSAWGNSRTTFSPQTGVANSPAQ